MFTFRRMKHISEDPRTTRRRFFWYFATTPSLRVGGMRFGVEPGFWVSGTGVSGDTSIFARTGPGMSFSPTPSRVPDSQKYIFL